MNKNVNPVVLKIVQLVNSNATTVNALLATSNAITNMTAKVSFRKKKKFFIKRSIIRSRITIFVDGTDESTCEYFITSQKRRENERESDNRVDQVHPAVSREDAERQRQMRTREEELKRREQEEARRETEERRREGEERRREEELRRREHDEQRKEEEERRRHQARTIKLIYELQ